MWSIYQANSVDILGDDGLLRHGRVVDLTDTGLLIDFLCPNRRCEFIPFGSVYLPTATQHLPVHDILLYFGADFLIPVELLMREPPCGPWMWVPAEIIALPRYKVHGRRYGMALVRWWNITEGRDFVRVERLRWRIPGPGGWWAAVGRGVPQRFLSAGTTSAHHNLRWPLYSLPVVVTRWTFEKCSMALPERFRLFNAATLLQQLNRELIHGKWRPSFSLVEIVDGIVWCIKRQSSGQRTAQNSENWTDWRWTVSQILCAAPGCLPNVPGPRAPTHRGRLPVELWLNVFAHLDTLTQNRLRLVCSLWNRSVDAPALMATIIISVGSNAMASLKNWDRLMYCMVSTIVRCVRVSSKHIVVVDRARVMDTEDQLKVVDIINYVGKDNVKIRLSAVYLVGFQCPLVLGCSVERLHNDACCLHTPHAPTEGDWFSWWKKGTRRLQDFIETCRGLPCNTLRLSRCILILGSGILATQRFHPEITVNISSARLMTGDDFECSLWNALEMSLPELDVDQLETLSTWLKAPAVNMTMDITAASRVLCATQTADPRPWLNYRGKEWCVNGLTDLLVKKLSRIALHFLMHFMKSSVR